MVNIVTPPMSPEPLSEIWGNVDDEDFFDLGNNNGTNLLSAFDMEAFAQELEEHPERFEDEIDFDDEEEDDEEFDLEIPELRRSDNMHEVHVIDPLDEDNMPLEPPQLIRQNAMNFTSFFTSVAQEYDPNSNNNPPANIIIYYPDPLDLI
tara:strand:+ start:997 stop:1446 length:450 start_codon:yes stop_codon:yes gene_type:complete